jgi:hypothetical protein
MNLDATKVAQVREPEGRMRIAAGRADIERAVDKGGQSYLHLSAVG